MNIVIYLPPFGARLTDEKDRSPLRLTNVSPSSLLCLSAKHPQRQWTIYQDRKCRYVVLSNSSYYAYEDALSVSCLTFYTKGREAEWPPCVSRQRRCRILWEKIEIKRKKRNTTYHLQAGKEGLIFWGMYRSLKMNITRLVHNNNNNILNNVADLSVFTMTSFRNAQPFLTSHDQMSLTSFRPNIGGGVYLGSYSASELLFNSFKTNKKFKTHHFLCQGSFSHEYQQLTKTQMWRIPESET